MSRVGNKAIIIPAGVTVTNENNLVTVKGPKGELSRAFHADIAINVEGEVINITRPSDEKNHRALHGTTRAVLANMVTGVSTGYTRNLEMIGVGYRAQLAGNKLTLNVGYSHPVEFVAEDGITFECPTNTKISISGIDKEKVGALAANVRAVRPPEPYKGKGIRYEGEKVLRKEGKTGK